MTAVRGQGRKKAMLRDKVVSDMTRCPELEMSVAAVAERYSMDGSTASDILNRLVSSGLLAMRKSGRKQVFSIGPELSAIIQRPL